MVTYISYYAGLNSHQFFCLLVPAELPERSRVAGSPGDYNGPNYFATNSPSAPMRGTNLPPWKTLVPVGNSKGLQ